MDSCKRWSQKSTCPIISAKTIVKFEEFGSRVGLFAKLDDEGTKFGSNIIFCVPTWYL